MRLKNVDFRAKTLKTFSTIFPADESEKSHYVRLKNRSGKRIRDRGRTATPLPANVQIPGKRPVGRSLLSSDERKKK